MKLMLWQSYLEFHSPASCWTASAAQVRLADYPVTATIWWARPVAAWRLDCHVDTTKRCTCNKQPTRDNDAVLFQSWFWLLRLRGYTGLLTWWSNLFGLLFSVLSLHDHSKHVPHSSILWHQQTSTRCNQLPCTKPSVMLKGLSPLQTNPLPFEDKRCL